MARRRATEASCQHTVGHWISAEEALCCQRKAYRPTNLQVCTYSVQVRKMKFTERFWVIAQAFLLEHLVLEHLVPRNA